MRNSLLLLLPVFIAFCGCSKPAGQSNSTPVTSEAVPVDEATAQTCPDFFYYYNQDKIPLAVNPEILLVGFAEKLPAERQTKLLAPFPEFAALGSEQHAAAGPFSIIKLKPGTTCTQALALTKKLLQISEITFANVVYKPPHTLGNTYAWVGLTSEFMVSLKSPAGLETFNKALTENQCRILDPLGETTFLVQVSKASPGNALEMANYFQEQPYVATSEPDFYLSAPGNQAGSKPE